MDFSGLLGLWNRLGFGPQETVIEEEEAIITPDSVVEKIAVEEDYTPSITDTVFSRAQGRGLDTQGEDSLANLNWMADTIGKIESGNNPDAEYQGPESSAKGEYQWLTNPKEGQPAFITAINRAINNYEDSGYEPPAWLYEAKKHGNPTELDRDQQREIFFADIFEREGSDALIKRIIESRDIDAFKELYLNKWHTNPDEATIDRVNRILSGNAAGGMVMRNPYNNYNKQRII